MEEGRPAQDWDPERYRRHGGFVAELGGPVVELLDPRPGERVLDLGCGDGALTARLAELGCRVTGVDAASAQVEAAARRGLDARVVDGEALDLPPRTFDAVFSNAALHWMRRPERVIAGVAACLRPGGRFVGEMGGAGNVATLHAALRRLVAAHGRDAGAIDPWFFPTPEAWRALLRADGFRVGTCDLIPRPTELPGDIGGWLETFGETFLAALPEVPREELIAALRDELAPRLRRPDGTWVADYGRLRFRAVLPG